MRDTFACKALPLVVSTLLCACAGQGVQVAQSKPHGVAELSIEHTAADQGEWVSDVAVVDGVALDLDQHHGTMRVRLSPGSHELVLHSAKMEMRNDVVQRPVGRPCLQDRLACVQPPFTEDSMELVPTEMPGCSTRMKLHVSAGETVRETMLVDDAGHCHREST
jgi:hypothetical protein